MLLLALSLAALVAGSAAAAACLRLPGPGFLLAVYLLVVAQIVVLTEALSLVHAVGRWGYLAAQTPLLAAAVAVWIARGRPRPPRLPRFSPLAAARAHPLLAALAAVVALALAYELFLALSLPPTTWDGMTYHLSRAAGWYQAGAVEYLDAHTTRQNVLPPNSEIQILYTFAFLGSDLLAAMPQFVAQCALVVAIYGIARRLGYERPASAFAALLFPTLTQVALQATSTQNDLAVAAPIAAAAYFVLGRRDLELPLAGLAVGLAVGTKLTALPMLPILALLALLVLSRPQLMEAVAWAAAGFAVVGAWTYLQNVSDSGSPLGDSPEAESFRPEVTPGGTISSVARMTYRFADLSGVDLDIQTQDKLRRSGEFWFETLGIDANAEESTAGSFRFTPHTRSDEDQSYFGPLGILLLLPLSATFLVAWALRRAPRTHGVLALALPFFIVAVALTHRYNPWVGRFLLVPVALTLPLAAAVYPRRFWSALVTVIAVVTLTLAHTQNVLKAPGDRPWELSRNVALTAHLPDHAPALDVIDRRVPPDARLGTLLEVDAWDYPLYGERLQRSLVQLPAVASFEQAEDRGLRWIVADRAHAGDPAHGWSATRLQNGWVLYERVD